jgi:hypothetical protein
VSKTLDGINLRLILSATGSGKTGYFFIMVLMVIIAISNNNPQVSTSNMIRLFGPGLPNNSFFDDEILRGENNQGDPGAYCNSKPRLSCESDIAPS